ncbi:MAG: serine hydrolase domain-containing protein [Pseudomonadota bacterium]
MLKARLNALLCCAAVTLAGFALPSPTSADVSIGNTFALNRVLNEFVERGDYPFIYARLESFEGRVLYEYSTKNELLLPDADIDGQTWMRIWSMSKIVTITLAMDLVEDGVISLDDPVTDYIPELSTLTVARGVDEIRLSAVPEGAEPCPLATQPASTPITLRNLINHTAGFHYAVTGIECLDALSRAQNLPGSEDTREFIDRLAALPLVHEPGTDYFYGLNTTVLGMALERATRSSLQELVEERITKPLRIRGLQYALPEKETLLPHFTGTGGTAAVTDPTTLDIFGGELPRYDRRNELQLGGEGMLATADGYADFLRMLGNGGMLRGHRVLDDTSLSEMTSPQTLINNPAGYNGYNLWVTNGSAPDGQAGLWLGGGYESTHFWIDTENEFVGVIMSQMHAPPAAEVSRDEAFRAAVYNNLIR